MVAAAIRQGRIPPEDRAPLYARFRQAMVTRSSDPSRGSDGRMVIAEAQVLLAMSNNYLRILWDALKQLGT